MKTRPLVSVLTPSFNQGRWLPDNIHSVAAQSYPHIEHIVMDGASSDGSVELLHAAGDRVRWRSEPDGGQSNAINKAFAVARGEIIGWLNSDDAYFTSSVVDHVVASFVSHPDVAVIYGHAVLVNADGLILQTIWVPPYHRDAMKMHNYIIQPAAFVRRSVVGATLVDESYDYMMDRELWLRLATKHEFLRLPRILAIDRHHAGRKSYLRQDLAVADRRRLSAKHELPAGFYSRVLRKAWKFAFRVFGIGLVFRLQREPFAFVGSVDGIGRLIVRQVGMLRSWMPQDKTES